jgi:endonuclease I
MQKHFISFLVFLSFSTSFSQAPAGYYNGVSGVTGSALQSALHNIIKNHTVTSYSNLYAAFDSTDLKPNLQVWDMYSDNPSGTPPYVYYNNSTYQCGNYNSEGDCFNREHSWPQSWFNGVSPPYSDLFHLFPTDGWVNNKRNNYPYGEVSNPSWTSMNGGKLGPNTTVGYNLTVFEPIDAYKGDIARGYFYMATRYLGEDSAWSSSDATNKAMIEPWELCVLLSWHHQDPVSTKEINRCNAIYRIQHNRNPYIDHPEWVDSVFTCTLTGVSQLNASEIKTFPNPCHEKVTIEFGRKLFSGELVFSDLLWRPILIKKIEAGEKIEISLADLTAGVYLLNCRSAAGLLLQKKIIVE